jgi:predicted nucleotidyltransferase
MRDPKIRRHIAVMAARLMYAREESEYFTAKRKAAAQLGADFRYDPRVLPSNREIRDEIQALALLHEGPTRAADLADMRVAALRIMRLLAAYHPHLIGSVATGHVRRGSDIDLHVFSASPSGLAHLLEMQGFRCEIEHKRVIKHNQERLFTHIHVADRFNFELTVYAPELRNYVFRSSITGGPIVRLTTAQLEQLVAREHPDAELGGGEDGPARPDPYTLWPLLLGPLADVRQSAKYHPEGDALYHSLQAFELARERFPYDVELSTAALLHDVGKAIEPREHVAAGLEALEGTLTEREEFLIRHHMDALAYRAGTLGAKLTRRLRASEWFEDLLALREIDDAARVRGAAVCTVEEAVEYLQELGETGEWGA